MADKSQLQAQHMATAAGKVNDAASQIHTTQKKLQGQVQQLLANGWRGDSADAFGRVHADFDQEFQGVIKDLKTIHEKLVATHKGYVAAEEQKKHVVNRIGAQINH